VTVAVDAPHAAEADLAALHRYAEATCPVVQLLRTPATVRVVTA
jgi:organic hydroperoxide reductase OsmC/OhrA